MLIICPTCSSSYLIRATEIGPEGRLVRCGSCKNSWQIGGHGDRPVEHGLNTSQEIENKEEIQPLVETIPSHPSARPNRRIAAGGLALAALASVFVLPIGKIADVARAFIGRVIPSDPFTGLDFEQVSSQLVAENDEIVLVVEGSIVAKAGEQRDLPGLALAIRGEDKDQIFRWTVKPPAETITAGTPIPFKVRLASPPITGREVMIRFVDASEVGDASAS